MALKAAICSSCSGQIKVDNTAKTGTCEHCNTSFITEEVINNYVTNYSSTHNDNRTIVKNIHGREKLDIEDYLKNADTFIKLEDWDSAEAQLDEATKTDPSDWRVWLGQIRCCTKNFATPSLPILKQSYFELYKKATAVASLEQRQELATICSGYEQNLANGIEKGLTSFDGIKNLHSWQLWLAVLKSVTKNFTDFSMSAMKAYNEHLNAAKTSLEKLEKAEELSNLQNECAAYEAELPNALAKLTAEEIRLLEEARKQQEQQQEQQRKYEENRVRARKRKKIFKMVIAAAIAIMIISGGLFGYFYFFGKKTFFENAQTKHYKVGQTEFVKFGRYITGKAGEEETVTWRVVAKHGDKFLLWSDKILASGTHSYAYLSGYTNSSEWMISFYNNAFEDSSCIITPNFEGSKFNNESTSKVFLLSKDEVKKLAKRYWKSSYTSYAKRHPIAMADPNAYLLRRVQAGDNYYVKGKEILSGNNNPAYGFRPAMWIDTAILFN